MTADDMQRVWFKAVQIWLALLLSYGYDVRHLLTGRDSEMPSHPYTVQELMVSTMMWSAADPTAVATASTASHMLGAQLPADAVTVQLLLITSTWVSQWLQLN